VKINILFLGSGPSNPTNISMKEKYKWFSMNFTGSIVTPAEPAEFSKISTINSIYNFQYYPFLYYQGNSVIRNLSSFFLMIFKALKIHYSKQKFDIIISPNPLTTGIVALLIGKITNSKVIIEVNGNFDSAFLKDSVDINSMEKVKHWVSQVIIPFTLKSADIVKLVYKDQLAPLKMKDEHKIKTISFANFVPISHFAKAKKADHKYILLLGYPWHLKGVDILIKAFKKVSSKIPEYRLKIVGWCPEGRGFFEDMAKDNSKIELCEPVYYDQVIKLMTECSLYVLASRTDSSPRVLREAMASKKPIIASNIDGVPALIIDKYNGLLFEKENVDDLADKILLVLFDKKLAKSLAETGYKYVYENLSEECYVNNYSKLISEVMNAG